MSTETSVVVLTGLTYQMTVSQAMFLSYTPNFAFYNWMKMWYCHQLHFRLEIRSQDRTVRPLFWLKPKPWSLFEPIEKTLPLKWYVLRGISLFCVILTQYYAVVVDDWLLILIMIIWHLPVILLFLLFFLYSWIFVILLFNIVF